MGCFCYICEKYTTIRDKITETVQTRYKDSFKREIEPRYKCWVLHLICRTYLTIIVIEGGRKKIQFQNSNDMKRFGQSSDQLLYLFNKCL